MNTNETPERDAKLEAGAKDFAERFEDVMKDLAEETPESVENPTFYKTIVSSPQWQEWVKLNEEDSQWDVHESMECGWLSEGHFQAFLQWCVSSKMSEVESVDIEQNRELYGTDFAAGMEKMKNIIIKSLSK